MNTKENDILLVPLEVIPEQMSIEQFVEEWKNQEPDVLKIVNTKCKFLPVLND